MAENPVWCLLTALRLRVQSSLHLLPSTTGLFKKISGLSLATKTEQGHGSIYRSEDQKWAECTRLLKKINARLYFVHSSRDGLDIMTHSREWLTLASWACVSTMPLAHITQTETSLVKTSSPVITALELRDFSPVIESHFWLRGIINYHVWHGTVQYIIISCLERNTVFISNQEH